MIDPSFDHDEAPEDALPDAGVLWLTEEESIRVSEALTAPTEPNEALVRASGRRCEMFGE